MANLYTSRIMQMLISSVLRTGSTAGGTESKNTTRPSCLASSSESPIPRLVLEISKRAASLRIHDASRRFQSLIRCRGGRAKRAKRQGGSPSKIYRLGHCCFWMMNDRAIQLTSGIWRLHDKDCKGVLRRVPTW